MMNLNDIVLTEDEVNRIESDMWKYNRGKLSDAKIRYDIELCKQSIIDHKIREAQRNGPTLEKLYDFILDKLNSKIILEQNPHPKYSLVYLDCQSGKRTEILGHAVRCLKNGNQVIIITDNFNSHKVPLIDTIKNLVALYNDNYNSRFSIEDIMYVTNKFSIDTWETKMQTQKLITVCILNITPLKKIYKGIINQSCETFRIIVDEADVGTIKDVNNSKPVQRTDTIQRIMMNIRVCTVFVTATPISFIKAKQDYVKLYGKDMHMIESNDMFITAASDNFITQLIDERLKDGKLNYNNIKDIIDNETIDYNWRYGTATVVLITVSKTVEDHKSIKTALKEDYPRGYVLVVNESEIKVYYPSNESKQFTNVSDGMNGVREDWEKSYESTGIRSNRYVFIVGYNMLARSVSHRSELRVKPKHCWDMLICNNQIYVASNKDQKKVVDTCYQGATRTYGYYPYTDEFKQPQAKLFSTRNVIDIVKNHHNDVIGQIKVFNENEYEDIRITAAPVSQALGKNRISSKSKIPHDKNYKYRGQYFVTDLSMERAKTNQQEGGEEPEQVVTEAEGNEISQLGEGTLAKRIYDVLFETKCWMTCKEVEYFYNDWKIGSKNVVNSIAKELFSLFNNGYIQRRKNTRGVYIYIYSSQ